MHLMTDAPVHTSAKPIPADRPKSIGRIESAMGDRLRRRLLRVLGQLTSSARSLTVSLKHDSAYRLGNRPTWLLRRSQLEITIGGTRSDRRIWQDVEIDLRSGPDKLYRYYPFSAFIYVGDDVAAIVEFDGAQENRTAYVRLPVGRTSLVTVAVSY